MSKSNGPALLVTSPAPEIVKTIELHEETHESVITVKHIDMSSQLSVLQSTLEKPTVIVASNSRSDSVLFINERVLSSTKNHPFTAAVKIAGSKGLFLHIISKKESKR